MTARLTSASSAPVRQSSVRAHNLALVLSTVADSADPPSRAAVATLTGLTRATVSALVDDLIAGGLLTELDPPPRTGAGRPAAGLALASTGPAGLGLEINVDYLAVCVVDLTGAVRQRLVEHADQRPAAAADALAALGRLAARARHAAEADGLVVAGAALAVPGLVSAGSVLDAPNLGWQNVDALALLRGVPELADLSIVVENEANLAALGELRVAGGEQTFLYVSGEIGIGAGLVIDGQLYRGARGWSGEIGHVTVHPDGRACRCGSNGCLEQYAGQEALGAGEPQAAAALGIALAAVVNLLDVPVIVLGGAYATYFDRLRDGIEAELRRRVLTARLAPVTLRAARLGTNAAVRGAADAVVRGVRDDPAAWLRRVG
ncbi:ROK family protein [Micromonospora sp. WMMD1128]|uniref:ROK family protein n=1 Tax=unclassified Micromonospora TaxID=2617518 RepID=UPI00248D0574|nr:MULTISPECIES: ROK family protein [unclassified Micromonospora]WBB73887.1 ROK family protein [Micromonospora sp. WMMD1128]WFE32706.1 ROK family protein [Micromonospora sp. WMMD975]